jgi:hypothetical protein
LSNGPAAGDTTVTDLIHNAGSTASYVQVVIMFKFNTGGLYSDATLPAGMSCAYTPAPSGWNLMFACQIASIAGNTTTTVKNVLEGTNGETFTRFVSVGPTTPVDPNYNNNTSTVTSWLGNLADLSLSQRAVAGGTTGTGTVATTVTNAGPWSANHLQLVLEIKGSGLTIRASGGPSGAACQLIPPSSGYNYAADCTLTQSLAPGQSWTENISCTGTANAQVTQAGSVSANSPPDPNTANNKATTSITLHA